MQDKVIVTKYIVSNHASIDMPYWLCLMFLMPMIFFFVALLNIWKEGECIEVLLDVLSKGMFYCNMFILLIFIGAKKF